MKTILPDLIEGIIKDSDFEKLIGIYENEYLDCKGGIYTLANDLDKRELAKDVSSFANTEGGYILIGPQTVKSETHPFEEISRISYLRQNLVDPNRYFSIIREWIYPEIVGMTIYWKRSKNDPNNGILVIHIPNQEYSLKPFLITKTIVENKTNNIIFGYAERKRDQTSYKNVQIMHALIRDGLNYINVIKSGLEEIKSNTALSKKKEDIEVIADYEQDISQRIKQILDLNGMKMKRSYALIAYPQKPNRLKTFSERKEGSIQTKLEHPGYLRNAGWDLETLDRVKIIEGKYLQVTNGDRMVIRLYRDGVLIFVSDYSYWAWPDHKGLKVNCLSIVESVYNFVRFYKDVVDDFTVSENVIFAEFGYFNVHQDGEQSYLCPYGLDAVGYKFCSEKHYAPSDTFISEPFKYTIGNVDIRNIAYEFIKEIYVWYGVSTDEGRIPYIMEENSIKMVNVDEIKTL